MRNILSIRKSARDQHFILALPSVHCAPHTLVQKGPSSCRRLHVSSGKRPKSSWILVSRRSDYEERIGKTKTDSSLDSIYLGPNVRLPSLSVGLGGQIGRHFLLPDVALRLQVVHAFSFQFRHTQKTSNLLEGLRGRIVPDCSIDILEAPDYSQLMFLNGHLIFFC